MLSFLSPQSLIADVSCKFEAILFLATKLSTIFFQLGAQVLMASLLTQPNANLSMFALRVDGRWWIAQSTCFTIQPLRAATGVTTFNATRGDRPIRLCFLSSVNTSSFFINQERGKHLLILSFNHSKIARSQFTRIKLVIWRHFSHTNVWS